MKYSTTHSILQSLHDSRASYCNYHNM